MTASEQAEERETVDTLTIFTLLVRCPTGGLPSPACPFARHRDQHSLEEKLRIAESLPENRRREMLAFHKHCQAKTHARENKFTRLK